jgi:glutamyl-tRNA reductase
VLDLLAHTLTNKLLHAPSAALREDAALGEAAIRLFTAGKGDTDA